MNTNTLFFANNKLVVFSRIDFQCLTYQAHNNYKHNVYNIQDFSRKALRLTKGFLNPTLFPRY